MEETVASGRGSRTPIRIEMGHDQLFAVPYLPLSVKTPLFLLFDKYGWSKPTILRKCLMMRDGVLSHEYWGVQRREQRQNMDVMETGSPLF